MGTTALSPAPPAAGGACHLSGTGSAIKPPVGQVRQPGSAAFLQRNQVQRSADIVSCLPVPLCAAKPVER